MEFGWTPAQEEIHARMLALGARAEAADPDARVGVLAEGGALGLALPTAHGGGGLNLVTTARAYEGLGAALPDAGALLVAGAHLFGVALALARVGTPEQQAAWLPRLARGEVIATVAATELESGSDVASVRTMAEPIERGFRVSGQKRYVTYADRAGLFLVIARAGADATGLTTLLVPGDAAGLRAGPPLPTAGLRTARLAPLELSGCEVTESAVLGRVGAGLAVFQVAMTFERALILAFRLGAMQRELDAAVEFAKTRRLGDTPIARHQAVAHRIARMRLRLDSSRLLVYRAAWALDRGDRAQAEAALAKWHVADAALTSSLDAFHVRGGAGYLEEGGLPAAIDDALGGTLHSGTQDVLATIVARWLGL